MRFSFYYCYYHKPVRRYIFHVRYTLYSIDLGGENLGGRGEPLQHGPVQVFSFLRSLDDLRPEHLTWSHLKQMEHSTDTGESCLLQSAQNHLGPGFCSIPALISNSQIRQAGVVLFFVNHIKNTVQLRNVPHCRI